MKRCPSIAFFSVWDFPVFRLITDIYGELRKISESSPNKNNKYQRNSVLGTFKCRVYKSPAQKLKSKKKRCTFLDIPSAINLTSVRVQLKEKDNVVIYLIIQELFRNQKQWVWSMKHQ